jgi:uncharacterized protein (DUF2336 family)
MIGSNDSAERLVELAKQRSLARRRRLQGEMVDLFLPDAHRLNDRDRAMMSGILRKLLSDVEMDIRSALAARLADENILPAELTAALGNGEVEWTRALLAETGALNDIELIEQIDLRARTHQLSGFLRQSGAESEDAALDAHGDDVLESLLRHPDGAISKRAMEMLVAEARAVDRYREPLLLRQDLPAELAEPLYWRVAAALRFALLRDFTIDSLLLDDLIESSARAALAGRTGGDATAFQAARLLVARLQESGALAPETVTNALRHGRLALATAAFASLTRLDPSHALRLMLSADGDSLAIACKANAIDRKDLAALLDLLTKSPENRALRQDAARALTFFDKLSPVQADAVCRHWRLHSGYKRAVESFPRNA